MIDIPASPRMPGNRASPLLMAPILLAVSAYGASAPSMLFQRELESVRCHLSSLASTDRDRRRRRFNRLAQQWRDETELSSSTTEISMHPGYQSIIGMGEDALPFILHDLSNTGGHWFWALKTIANEDPVAPESRGVVEEMKAAWLNWGREKGISWDDLCRLAEPAANYFSLPDTSKQSGHERL